jgi:hypothetical protein
VGNKPDDPLARILEEEQSTLEFFNRSREWPKHEPRHVHLHFKINRKVVNQPCPYPGCNFGRPLLKPYVLPLEPQIEAPPPPEAHSAVGTAEEQTRAYLAGLCVRPKNKAEALWKAAGRRQKG